MPTVLRVEGYRFYFYSMDGREPPHVHVEHGEKLAKLWLDPVQLVWSEGFRPHELRRLRAVVIAHRVHLQEAWREHFGNTNQH